MKKTTVRAIFSPMMLGFFGNNILPAHLGEFIKMHLAAKKLQLTNTQVLATIILERILDILTVTIILTFIIYFDENLPTMISNAAPTAYFIFFLLFSSTLIATIWTPQCVQIINILLFIIPEKSRKKIINHIRLGLESLHAIKSATLLSGIVVTSILQWAFMALTIYISLLAVNIDLPLSVAFVILIFTMLAVIIPTAPGYIGSIQIAFVLALVPYNTKELDAVSASLFFHFFTYFAIIFLGLYLIHKLGYQMRQLKKEAEVDKDQT